MTDTSKTKERRTVRMLSGEVVSDRMDKTILVRVDRMLVHNKYGKRYVQSKRYAVHDEENVHKVGDQVRFRECRPLSKKKRWRVVKQ